jgi:hypothetical protein
MKVLCNICNGQGWVFEIETRCCGNYESHDCCQVPVPVQVQVECKCDKGMIIKKPKCNWCTNDATTIDYRDNGGCVSKIRSCSECYSLSTEFLYKRLEAGHDV